MAIRRVLSYINMDAFLSLVRMRSTSDRRKEYNQIMASTLDGAGTYPRMVGVGLEQREQPNEVEILIAGGLINGELIN